MQTVVGFLALALAGPLVGFELAVAAVMNPIASTLSDGAFRLTRSAGSRQLGAVMPFWYICVLVLAITNVVFVSDAFAISAAVLFAVVSVVSVTVLVPINNRIGRWASDSDVDRDLATRWDRYHWLRVALLFVAFLSLARSAY